jgi:hypothetical protein
VCIGTSATLAAEVARVASLIFGTAVHPRRVIGEVLRRRTAPLDLTDRAVVDALRDRVRAGVSTNDPVALERDLLTSWIESAMGLETSQDGRLVRRTPRTLEAVAAELAAVLGIDVDTCAGAIAGMLLTKTSAGRPFFSLRLHQFLSKGNTVFATLEPEDRRHLTLSDQPVASDNRRLYPLVFCRECGQEYYAVGRRRGEGGVTYESRRRDLAEDHTVEPGYLYLNTREPWPDAPDAIYPRLPDTWFEHKNGPLRLRRDRQEDVPQPCNIATDGSESRDGLRVHFIRAPFRFCLQCCVHHSAHARSDFGKLATLGTEGRSTATTLLSLSTIRHLRHTGELEPSARKLLSFTDNRQDASLQAGHFNDFIHIVLVRSALWRAIKRAGPSGLTHEQLTDAVFAALDLPLAAYAINPTVEYSQREETDRALRRILGYHVYRDLKRGWRLVAPNLEQSGLLAIDYRSLDVFCADEPRWAGLDPALARASPAQRGQICRVLLDHLRRELAIRVEYLDEARRDAMLQMSSQYLVDPWQIDDQERLLEYSSVAFPCGEDPRIRHPRAHFVSPRGGFARYVRQTLNVELKSEDLERILGQLFEALVIPSLLERVTPARDGAPPGYMVAASGMIWLAGDGQQRSWDPVRLPRKPTHGIRTNKFFTDFYQGNNHDLHGFEAREHTAQVSNTQRRLREERFRNAALPILYCSPTMELGVDIRDLNVVNMRNIPPTPANYAQRSGRGGRSGQPAFIYTYCTTGSPHDQYFFRRPEKMVAGIVSTPRLDLANEDLLRAHVHAIWLAEANVDLGDSLVQILDITGDGPAIPLVERIEKKLADESIRASAMEHAAAALGPALEDFLRERGEPVDAWLRSTFDALPDRFNAACDRWRSLYTTAKAQLQRQRKIAENHSLPANERDQAKRLREEADRQLSLLIDHDPDRQHSDFYPYRYLASEGFLPGYNFPRLPISAYLPGSRKRRRGSGRDDEYISRPRFLAISEFGPRALLYHEGSRYVINRVLLSADSADGVRRLKVRASLCRICGYVRQLGDEPAPDRCVRCNAALDQAFNNLFRMRHVAARRRDRITCDEEERQRLGYEIKTGIHFAGQERGQPDSRTRHLRDAQGAQLAELTYAHAATVWRINLGWRHRKPDQPPGFELDTERGYWVSRRPDNEENPDPEDRASPQQERVIPYVDDTRNCLLLRPTGELSQRFLASLQAALKTAIQIHFQLEDRELAAEPLPSVFDRQQILFYEASEGGAGVLRQLVDDKKALAEVARIALDLCHFDPQTGADLGHAPGETERCEAACYECLMSYSNQFDQPLLDRKLLPAVLLEWSRAEVRPDGPTDTSSRRHEDPLERFLSLCTTDLERRFLRLIHELGLSLPDTAQKRIDAGPCTASFFYSAHGVAVFIDDASHDELGQARSDDELSERLEQVGYGVVRFHHAADWEAHLRAHASIFGTGKPRPTPSTRPTPPPAPVPAFDPDLFHGSWVGPLQLLAAAGVTVDPGSDVNGTRGRVAGRYVALIRSGDASIHLIDAADPDAARAHAALAAAGALSLVLSPEEAAGLDFAALRARIAP